MTHILKISWKILRGMCKSLKGLYLCGRMMYIFVCVHIFSQQAHFNLLLSQHLLPSAVHHHDSRDSGRRGSGWRTSPRLPHVMDRNRLESPNGSDLTLTSSRHDLHDPSTYNLWPLRPDSATRKQKWVKKRMTQLHLFMCSFYLILGVYFQTKATFTRL